MYTVLAFDAAQTVLVTAEAFKSFVNNFGNVVVTDNVGYAWFAVPAMSGWSMISVKMCSYLLTNQPQSHSWYKAYMGIDSLFYPSQKLCMQS